MPSSNCELNVWASAHIVLMAESRPGDYLKPEDEEIAGFKARLNERLAPVGTQFSGEGVNDEWQIGDAIPHLLSRYNFEFVDDDGNVTAMTPGIEAPRGGGVKVEAEDDEMKTEGENGVNGTDARIKTES